MNELMSKISDRDGLAALRAQFDLLDTDGSGQLDINEFRMGLKGFGMRVTDNDAAALLSAFDPSGDGELDFEEFTMIAKRELEVAALESALESHDAVTVHTSQFTTSHHTTHTRARARAHVSTCAHATHQHHTHITHTSHITQHTAHSTQHTARSTQHTAPRARRPAAYPTAYPSQIPTLPLLLLLHYGSYSDARARAGLRPILRSSNGSL
jgi:hypothetical protein